MAMQQPPAAGSGSMMPVDIKQPVQVAVPAQRPAPPLPAGWFEMKDPSGRTMYFNSANGTTTWQRPMVRQLPPGWIKAQTPDGKAIFVHTATQQCSFQFPMAPGTPAIPSAPAAVVDAKPPLTRITSTPTQPGPTTPGPANPTLRRATTMPVNASRPANVRDPSLVTVSMNTAVARKSIPGFNEAHAIHQISTRNNSQVLGKKLGADVAHAGVALKDTTITAASLATRQAKAVGQTMVSKSKMQKASKKAIVHTGALGVKIGRASKTLMHEMVDAADGKGKYKPKVRSYVPQDPLPATAPGQKNKPAQVHAYEYEQAASQGVQQVQQVAVPPTPTNTGVPARKPVKRPSVSLEFTQNTVLQAAQPAMPRPPMSQTGQSPMPYIETAEGVAALPEMQLMTTAEKPPRPTMDVNVNASVEVSAQASLDVNLTGSNNSKPPSHIAPATPHNPAPHQFQVVQQQHPAQPLKPTQPVQLQHPPSTPSASFSIQADVNANASFTYQSQSSSNAPPPPYTPQTQPASAAPAQVVRPRPRPRPQQQQQPQQIVIQQQDGTADAYLQTSNIMALQQQIQALQLQQQLQLSQQQQQQQIIDHSTTYQTLEQQQQPVYAQDTTQEQYYFVDDNNNSTTSAVQMSASGDGGGVGDVYALQAQQQEQVAYVDASGQAAYAQETTTTTMTTMTTTEEVGVVAETADGGEVVYAYAEETAVCEYGYDGQEVAGYGYDEGQDGGLVYAEEVDVYEVEGGEMGGIVEEEGECGECEYEYEEEMEMEMEEEAEAEAECDFECDF